MKGARIGTKRHDVQSPRMPERCDEHVDHWAFVVVDSAYVGWVVSTVTVG